MKKTVGLITEYNPFHSGHAYHLREALTLTGADRAVVVMSGDYVQRGAPAVFSKYVRAEAALRAGAAAVFELPLCCSCQSAEYFAEGAVSLLDRLGIIDSICFGCEDAGIDALHKAADILSEEPAAYRRVLQDGLKQGLSFPLARQKAVREISPEAALVLASPNHILGIEYLKALKKRNSAVKPFALKRKGGGYHEETLHATYSSATAIRKILTESDRLEAEMLHSAMPPASLSLLKNTWQRRGPLCMDDFSLLLKSRLLAETPLTLASYADVSPELASRMFRYLDQFYRISGFTELLKTKELTYSRISRALLHILLGIRTDTLIVRRQEDYHNYARLLGFRRDCTSVLTDIKATSSLPLVTNPARADSLSASGRAQLKANVFATALYDSVLTDKYGHAFENEQRRKMLVV